MAQLGQKIIGSLSLLPLFVLHKVIQPHTLLTFFQTPLRVWHPMSRFGFSVLGTQNRYLSGCCSGHSLISFLPVSPMAH